ncbi:hypothetical protein KR054_010398 [Drosophila jambulina]|nr:hypothetical protein KR054_010398 [Drosophila jambulina]
MFDFRKLSASKVSAGILRVLFLFAGYTDLVFFRLEKDQFVAINRTRWKEGISLILRFIVLGIHIYTYSMFIGKREKFIEQMLNILRLLLSIPCFLAMIYIQFFHGPKVIRLMNQYLKIVREVRRLAIRKRIGFGGGHEFILILLSLACQIQDIIFLLGLLRWAVNLRNIMNLIAYSALCISSNMILHISFIWYLSLGILYKELNDYLRSETRNQSKVLKHQRRYQPLYKQLRKIRRLRKAFSIFKELYYVVCSLQNISNIHLFLDLTQTVLYLIVVSYKMIVDLNFCQFWLWFLFVKIMIVVLIVTLAIQGAVNQFCYTREVLLDIFFISDLKDWKRTAEIFVVHLNLCKLRVRFLGLFEVSNELFLVIISGMFTYLAFIVQCVMQLKK